MVLLHDLDKTGNQCLALFGIGGTGQFIHQSQNLLSFFYRFDYLVDVEDFDGKRRQSVHLRLLVADAEQDVVHQGDIGGGCGHEKAELAHGLR